MRTTWTAVLLATLGACATPYKLDPKKVQAVTLHTANGEDTVCVGGPPQQAQAEVVLDNGTRVVSWVPGRSKKALLEVKDFAWAGERADIDGDGVVRPAGDPVATMDQPIRVRATVVGRPDMSAAMELRPRYDCGVALRFDGAPGRNGSDGTSGTDGFDGSSASGDSSPGNGTDGGNGADGDPGKPGGAGAAVDVVLTMAPASATGEARAVARISAPGRGIQTVMFALTGPALSISARGGNGGKGGDGGNPGHGGKAGTNSDNNSSGSPGRDGSYGSDGKGGTGGAGGIVVVHYDPAHPELKEHVAVDTRGGDGGRHGGQAGRSGSPAVFVPLTAITSSAASATSDSASPANQPGVR